MDKTIRAGDLTVVQGYVYWFVNFRQRNVFSVHPCEKLTSEYADDDENICKLPDTINAALMANEAVLLYKFAVENGMSEHESLTYWLRDYVVEKIREAQNIP